MISVGYKYKLANKYFNTKSEIHTEISNFILNHNPGYIIKNNNNNNWIYELFKTHPNAKTKLLNMKYLKVDIHPQYRIKCIFIIYKDNSVDDISFRRCIYEGIK